MGRLQAGVTGTPLQGDGNEQAYQLLPPERERVVISTEGGHCQGFQWPPRPLPDPLYTHTRVHVLLPCWPQWLQGNRPSRAAKPKGKLSLVALNLNSFFVRSSSRFSNWVMAV